MDPQVAEAKRKRRRKVSGIVLVLLFFLVYWPGGVVLEGVELTIAGWPFFTLWTVVIAPWLILGVFMYNAYRNVQLDRRVSASEEGA